MHSIALSREPISGNRSPPVPYNVVIMREDFQTGKRAMKGLDHIAEQFGNDLEVRHSMWRLDVLQEPKLNVLMASALEKADLLIISLRSDRQLLAKIRALVDEQLTQTSNRECALVALFAGAPSETRSWLQAYLTNLARRHRLDFFEEALSDTEDHKELSMKLLWVF